MLHHLSPSPMTHDRPIEISIGASRKSTEWTRTAMPWSQLARRLRAPLRSGETLEQYMALPADLQAELKDRGGFVGGTLKDGRRKAGNVLERHVLALDLDNIPEGCTDEALRRIESLGAAYIVYSTRKHCPAAPRLRVLLALDQPCTAEQYEPLARLCAHMAGVLEWADPTTFEASRLMYWPTACADGEFVYRVGDHPMLGRDEALATYADWRDATTWPQVPGEERKAPPHHAAAARQGNPGCMGEQGTQFPTSPGCVPLAAAHPEMKSGIVGAFCRAYDICRAMAELLPGVYVPTDMANRYTYTGGTTAGGAVVYDDGSFLYSHHATDPCCGELVNAYDLVRLHRFGELDRDCPPDLPVYRRPSMRAMKALALGLPEIKRALEKESVAREGNPPSGPREVNPPSGLRPGTHGRAVCGARDQPATSLAKGGKGVPRALRDSGPCGTAIRALPVATGFAATSASADVRAKPVAASGGECRHIVAIDVAQNTVAPPSSPAPSLADMPDPDWTALLARSQQTGAIHKTINNIVLVLDHDPGFAGHLALDEFSQRKLVVGDLPWRHTSRAKPRANEVCGTSDRPPNGGRCLVGVKDPCSALRPASPQAPTGNALIAASPRPQARVFWPQPQPLSRIPWTDYDDAQLIRVLEHEYGLGGSEKVRIGLMAALDGHRINVVTDWFDTLRWDGVARLERLFVDYLGAEDCHYVRAVTRKSFCAAVARAYQPGIKYDYVPTLLGDQGIGKSTLLATMGGDWFCDSLEVFEGKDAMDLIQGRLIIELGEMRALSRSDEAQAKHFLSKRTDLYRPPYGREVGEHPRRCVFFGTTNIPEFLRDPSGNRRFWPVACQHQPAVKDIFTDLPRERAQLWAEAVALWWGGETLYLDRETEAMALRRQREHRDDDPRLSLVADWLERRVPRDWASRNIDRRLMYWAGEFGTAREDAGSLVPRQTVSRCEVWTECLRQDPTRFTRRDAYDVSSILDALPGWVRMDGPFRNGPYGLEKGYRRRALPT